jgi:hypothetical protein
MIEAELEAVKMHRGLAETLNLDPRQCMAIYILLMCQIIVTANDIEGCMRETNKLIAEGVAMLKELDRAKG